MPAAATPTPNVDLTTGTTSNVAQLPTGPVPRGIAERIERGEFVDFDDLLPGVLAVTSRSGLEVIASDDSTLSVRTSDPRRRRRVVDFVSWTEAWTAYASVILSAAPHRCHELLGYQAIMANAAQQFYPEGWLEYDRRFRGAAASDPTRQWDVMDPTIWQLTRIDILGAFLGPLMRPSPLMAKRNPIKGQCVHM